MRDIKFRAWHQYAGNNCPGMIYDDKPGDCFRWKNEGQAICDIMQYTGLKDINKKPIFEGDLVKIYTAGDEYYCDKFLVEFGLYGWNLSDMKDGFMTFEYVFENGDSLEVIGNKYDHLELKEVPHG